MAMKTRYTNLGGQVVAVKTGGQRYFVEPDALGNVRALVNESGVRAQTYTYWPYGEVRTSTGSVTQPLQFCGTWGYYTESSSKQYVRARYYMQSLGRWQTVDPLWPSMQQYDYCFGRPMNYLDPSGMGGSVLQIGPEPIPNPVIPTGWEVIPGGATEGTVVTAGGATIGICSVIVTAYACWEICEYKPGKPRGIFTGLGDACGQRWFPGLNEIPSTPYEDAYWTRIRKIRCGQLPYPPLERHADREIHPGIDPNLPYPPPFANPSDLPKGDPRCRGFEQLVGKCPPRFTLDPPHVGGHYGCPWIKDGACGKCHGPHIHVIPYVMAGWPHCRCVPSKRLPYQCLSGFVQDMPWASP